MEIGGHLSPEMLRHCSHVRLQAKRSALDAVSAGLPEQQASPAVAGEDGRRAFSSQEAASGPTVVRRVGAGGREPGSSALGLAASRAKKVWHRIGPSSGCDTSRFGVT